MLLQMALFHSFLWLSSILLFKDKDEGSLSLPACLCSPLASLLPLSLYYRNITTIWVHWGFYSPLSPLFIRPPIHPNVLNIQIIRIPCSSAHKIYLVQFPLILYKTYPVNYQLCLKAIFFNFHCFHSEMNIDFCRTK